MKVELDIRLSAMENAQKYYEMAKKYRGKGERAKEVVILRKSKKEGEEEAIKHKWYHDFRWFEYKGFLVVAGRNANQNERLYKRMTERDLFLHADIVGAAFVIVRNGLQAPEDVISAAAQFAASYSRAWKFGYSTVDVYAVPKAQLTKYSQGEYVKKGSVVVKGERRWFRNTELSLCLGRYKGMLVCFPARASEVLTDPTFLKPGNTPKETVIHTLAKRYGVDPSEVDRLLPPGGFSIQD